MEEIVPKRWHRKFRSREITQKKEYNIQNTAKVLNQDSLSLLCTSFEESQSCVWCLVHRLTVLVA